MMVPSGGEDEGPAGGGEVGMGGGGHGGIVHCGWWGGSGGKGRARRQRLVGR
jgi:hypothetical protein